MTQDRSEKLYEAYYMRVFSYVMTLSGDRSQAEELTQETFFRALSKQSGFRGESDEATWLCAIAKNLFLDEKRRRSRFGELPEETPDRSGEMPEEAVSREKSVEQASVERDDSFRVHMALHALEEPYREVFELRIFGELSFREIGMIFRKAENWARVTDHRAKLKLRERMGET